MGLFGKTYKWKAHLSEQEVHDAIACMEEIVDNDKFAMGFQPPEVQKGILERKTALQLLKTKNKLTEAEIDLICSCLRKEIVLRQSRGQGMEQLRMLNNLGYAFSSMKSK